MVLIFHFWASFIYASCRLPWLEIRLRFFRSIDDNMFSWNIITCFLELCKPEFDICNKKLKITDFKRSNKHEVICRCIQGENFSKLKSHRFVLQSINGACILQQRVSMKAVTETMQREQYSAHEDEKSINSSGQCKSCIRPNSVSDEQSSFCSSYYLKTNIENV